MFFLTLVKLIQICQPLRWASSYV